MKRIVLTAAAARLLETQITTYEDQQDPQTKKFLRDPKERRQWGRIVQAFDGTTNVFDDFCRRKIEEGNKRIDELRKDQGKRVEMYLSRWDAQGVDPSVISATSSSLESLFGMLAGRVQTETNMETKSSQDDPSIGGVLLEIDVEDTGDGGGVEFLSTTWETIAGTVMSLEHETRKTVDHITRALRDATELVKVDGNYVPKTMTKPTLVKSEEAV